MVRSRYSNIGGGLLCRGTESPSQSGREHGIRPGGALYPRVGAFRARSTRHEARGTRHVDRHCDPMRGSDSSLYSILPRRTLPFPVSSLSLRLFPRPWGSQVQVGTVQSRPGLEERAQRPGCFRSTPVNLARQSGERGDPASQRPLLRSRSSLLCSVPDQTTASSYSLRRITMRLTRSSNREFSWLNRAASHVVIMTAKRLSSARLTSAARNPCLTKKIQGWRGSSKGRQDIIMLRNHRCDTCFLHHRGLDVAYLRHS